MLYTIALEVQFERQDKHPAAILGKLKASFFSFCKFLHIKSESKKQPSRKEQKNMTKMSEYKVVFVVYATIHDIDNTGCIVYSGTTHAYGGYS